MTKPIARLTIIYDGDCPFCSSYVSHVRLRDVVNELQYIDAREGGEVVKEAVRKGFHLDDGMIVIIDGVYHYGADALTALASLTSPIDAFNRISAKLLTSPTLSRTIYPFLRFGRNVTLRVLGRSKLALSPPGVAGDLDLSDGSR
jgi:predicted DCC family thiol-disulfide oxidoreductase YuxK